VIKEVEDEANNPKSLVRRERKLETLQVLLRGCQITLGKVRDLTITFASLGTNKKKFRDRLQFAFNDLGDARVKIAQHTSAITIFLANIHTTALGRIERKIDHFIRQWKGGQRNSSVLSLAESLEGPRKGEDHWATFRNELLDDDVSEVDIDDNRSFVEAYVQGRLSEDTRSSIYETSPKTQRLPNNTNGSHTGTPPVVPRKASPDPTVSSVSAEVSKSAEPTPYQPPNSSTTPTIQLMSLINTAGSTEAALQQLWESKQSADALKQKADDHNAQLWRLVEKQRTMLLGLNKDLERVAKDRDRYKKKIKESEIVLHGE